MSERNDKILSDLLAYNVKHRPNLTALLSANGQQLNWAEYQQQIESYAARLLSAGVNKGDVLCLAATPSLECYLLLWACARLGAVFAPVNLQFTNREIEAYLAPISKIRRLHLFADAHYQNIFAGILGELPRFSLAGATPEQWSALPEPATSLDNAPYPTEEDGLYLIPTSGSTGSPKPVLLPHRAIVQLARNVTERRNWQTSDRFLSMSPLFHISGLGAVGSSAWMGSSLHAMTGFDPATALKRIEAESITLLAAFDILLDRLVSLPEFSLEKIKTLRAVNFAGSPKFYDIIQSWGISDIATAYALSEGTTVSLMPYDCSDPHLRQWSAGKIMPQVQVKIIDPDSKQILTDGQSGEICIKGDNLFLGYLGCDEATLAAFDDDLFFHTGDCGHLEGEYLFFEGRYKAMIKTGGENVSQLEVENFLASHFPECRQIAVIGTTDKEWGEVVCACLELRPGETLDLQTLRSRCKGQLANFKIPKKLITMTPGSWPQLASNKLDKQALRDMIEQGVQP